MSDYLINDLDPDFNLVMPKARTLAINARHGFINIQHFFLAMMVVDCQAKPLLGDFNAEIVALELYDYYPAIGEETINDFLPLTDEAERLVHQAIHFSSEQSQPANSIHLLLAMLSYENSISDLLKKKGIIFYDINDKCFDGCIQYRPIELIRQTFKKPSLIARLLGLAASRKKQFEEISNHASNLFTYQQYDDCIATCKTGLELNPFDQGLKELMMYSFLHQRDFVNACSLLVEMTAHDPNNLDYNFSLSSCYDELGRHEEAEKILDRLLKKHPDDAYILNNRAFNLYNQRRFAEAVPFYEKAIKADPSFAYPYDNLGFVLYKLGNTTAALELIDKALALDKGNSFAYKYKGIIFFEQFSKATALQQFQLAIRYGYTKQYGNEVLEWIEQCK